MTKEDLYLAKKTGEVIIDKIVAQIDLTVNDGVPILGTTWGLAKGLYGAGYALRTERVVEIVETIQKNPDIFTSEILQSTVFQDGFVYALEKYFRERNSKKRAIAQKIFLGFATAKDMEEFDMERYLNTLSLLSRNGIEYLRFLEDDVKPIHEEWVRNEILPLNIKDYDNEAEAMVDLTRRMNLIRSVSKCEKEAPDGANLVELQSLGMAFSLYHGTIGGGSNTRNLTDYGYDFLDFLVGDK